MYVLWLFLREKALDENEFPEDDSYAKYLSWNFLHTHVVIQGLAFPVVGKLAKGKEREKWNLWGASKHGAEDR